MEAALVVARIHKMLKRPLVDAWVTMDLLTEAQGEMAPMIHLDPADQEEMAVEEMILPVHGIRSDLNRFRP